MLKVPTFHHLKEPFAIRRLRVICQKEKLRRENDLTRKHRAVSIYATYALVRTNVSADQVTVASIATGLVASLFLALGGLFTGLLGVALLYVSFLLDQVDGEVARYRKKTSLRGVYLDELRHLLIYAVPVFALSFDIARETGESWPFAVGFVAALGLALARIEARLPALIYGERASQLRHDGPVETAPAAPVLVELEPGSIPHTARAIVHAARRVYETLAHQVLILGWMLVAVVVDRGFGRLFDGVGLEGVLLLLLAATTTVTLLVAVVARARPGEVERGVRALSRRTA